DDVVFPVWWIALLILVAWGIGTFQREGPSSAREREDRRVGMRGLIVVGWLLTFLLSLHVSPVVAGDVGTGSVLVVLLLVTYFWWRGLRLGSTVLGQERLNVRFLCGLAAIILAIVSASTLHGAARSADEGSLALLLQFEVF